MSRFDAFTKGWTFRTSTPSFEPGTEITAFVTGREGNGYVSRIGDTVLQVEDTQDDGESTEVDVSDRSADGDGERSPDDGTDLVDSKVLLRVEEFSENDHTGRATVLERLDDGAF